MKINEWILLSDQWILLSVISFYCNIFIKLSVFYKCTFQTVRKVLVSYLYSLKEEHVRKPRVTLPQQQKTFSALSIERRVWIIAVEIRQPVVKIKIFFLNHHADNEAINTWLNYILELIRTKAGLLLAFFY